MKKLIVGDKYSKINRIHEKVMDNNHVSAAFNYRFYDTVYNTDHPFGYGDGRNDPGWHKRICELTNKTRSWLIAVGLAEKLSSSVLEVGCGLAYLKDIHPGWHGIEYSRSAVEGVKAKYGKDVKIYEADVQRLPFPNQSFDGIYSWATLEHVPDPHKAFIEIDRVLKEGGYALIAPAWNCRSWTVRKLPQLPYASLTFWEKVQKYSVGLRENICFRAILCLPGRIYDELRLLTRKQVSLRFKTLYPRWDIIEKMGHVTDDDAVAAIDPHSAITFFKSRNYEILSHPTWFSRMMARHEPVIVRKGLSL
ncbi:MAG: class I SAM-dependent methyltransferase [Candidatus Omnitrophica bacterium]|nr:class I SAM-dependent methyltransferase [Candidatus Omnitrophota bacterium]